MHLIDTPLDYIGVGIEHLPWSWWKYYQVLVPIWILQLVEGTNIEDYPQ